MVFDFNILLVF